MLTDPAARSEPLKPYADDTRREALQDLEDSLSNTALHTVPEPIRQTLAACVERDVTELLGALRARAMGLADGFASPEQCAVWRERAPGPIELRTFSRVEVGDDFSHLSILLGRRAPTMVYPRIVRFLEDR